MISILLYIISFLFIDNCSRKDLVGKHIKVSSILLFLLMTVFFCFRDLPVLNDTAHYYEKQEYYVDASELKNSIFDISWVSIIEPGFQVYQRILAKYIWADPYAIILVSSLLIIVGMIWFINQINKGIRKKQIPEGLLFFILAGTGILFEYHSVTRQGLAALLILIAYVLKCRDRKILIPSLLVIVAMTLHKTALVCLVPIVAGNFELTKKRMGILIISLTIISLFLFPILSFTEYAESKYIDQQADREATPWAAVLDAMLYVGLALYGYILKGRYNLSEVDSNLVWMVVIGGFFLVISPGFLIFTRFGVYFNIFLVVYFLFYLRQIPRRHYVQLKVLLIIVMLARSAIVLEYRNEWAHLVPYSFYDFSKKYHETELGY